MCSDLCYGYPGPGPVSRRVQKPRYLPIARVGEFFPLTDTPVA
jgi:hypothetical protein